MKPKIIPPTIVATEISDSLLRLAEDCELRGTAEERKEAAETRMKDLLTLFTPQESLQLIKLIVEPRIKCARCNAGRSMRDCSGEYCIECAAAIRRAAEVQ